MPDSEPACLALRLPLALLGLACAWQINHKMALWFNATSAPPDPVNSAASVPETPGPPAPAAKKQKTQAKAGRPSNLTAFNKKNADMIGRGDITRYLTTIPLQPHLGLPSPQALERQENKHPLDTIDFTS